MEDNYKNNVEKSHFETPKRYSVKYGNKTRDNETIITQNKNEVLSESNESDTNECNMIMTNYLIISRQVYHHDK